MPGAAELHRLQELDLAIDAQRAALAAVEEGLGRDEALVAARQDVERREEVLVLLRGSQQDLELAAEALRGRVKGTERKLYDGSVRNPRELADLQQDLEVLKRQLRGQEDRLLDLMLQTEEAETGLRSARDALAEMEAHWQGEQRELQAQQASLQAELADLSARRTQETQGLDTAAMVLYSTLRERRQGRAVAKVERGMCQGCRITLPMSLLQRARLGTELVQCTSCERILYMG